MENKFSDLLNAGTSYYSGLLSTDKEKAIIEANEEKIRSLQEYQKQREAAQARYEATLIGKLGLDPNGVVGSGVNLAANVGAGALSTISGQVGSGIHTLWGASNLADIPDEALAARKHMLDGTATQAEKELLDAPVGQSKQKSGSNRWQNDVEAAKTTNLDRIRAVEKAQRNAQAVRDALDFSKYVYQDNKEGLVNDLKAGAADDLAKVSKGWDQLKNYEDLAGWGNIASGLAGSTAEIGKAALKNPRGALEYVAENAPQMAAAFLGKGASLATNLLYGLDNYDRGLQAYSKDKGQIAPSNERTKMQALSAAAVAAETLGDKFVVGASKVGSDLASGIGSAAGNVSRKGFKDTLINAAKAVDNTAIARTGKAIIEGAAGEYPTEGVQTWLENETQGKPTSLEDAYVGAAIGAITGGTTSGTVHATGEVGKLAGSAITKTQDKLQEAAVTKAAVDAAAKTGDVSVFTNPESPVYSPTKALSALFAHNKLDETDNETREANINKGAEILSTMEGDLRTLKAQTPQGKQEIQQDLDKLKAQIAQVDPADTQTLDGLNQSATKLEELLAAPVAQGAEAKKLSKQIQTQIKEIEAASSLHEEMTTHAIDKMLEGLDLDEEVSVANAPVDTQDTAAVEKANTAAQKIITLSMVHRDRVTPEQAKQLADNTNNGLSESARNYFRAFSEAKVAELSIKTMGKVSQDVYYGDSSKDQMGIPQYRTRLNNALASGSQKMADRTLNLLDKFVSSHTGKEALAQEALAKANETGKVVSVARTNEGTWEILPVAFQTEAARMKNGGFNVNPGRGSLKLISNIQAEAKALTSAQAELQAAYDLKFKPNQATVAPTPTVAATTPVASTPNTQPAQPGTTGVGSGVSQTPQVAPTQSVGWSRYAKSGQGYEVSSKGDTRFSALNARLSDGRTIEEAYQLDVKGYRDPAIKNQSWKDGKGKPPKIKMTPKQQWEAYKGLWQQWAKENPQLIEELRQKSTGKTLTDMFAGTPVSQARALAEILNETTPSSTVSSTATTTKEETNGTETPQAVQAEEKGPQVQPATGTTETAESRPAVNESVKTEEKVEPINTSEGNVESTEENVQVQPETEQNSDGKLQAFASTVEPDAPFKKRNLIASDLKQSAGGEGVVTPRPLAAVKDFLTKWFDKKHDILKQYLGKDWNDLSEKQQDLLLAFRDKAKAWAPMFQASVGKKEATKSDYYFQDMMQFLIQSTNVAGKDVHTLEENVKTAMSYAAYSWIAENASRSAFNSPEEINAILGREDDHEVSDFEKSKLADAGTRRNIVINALGQRAVAALGISAKKSANKDTLTKLEGAIGTHIMRVLLDTGMLEQKTVDAATMALLRTAGEGQDGANHEFLKIKRDQFGELPNDVANIYTSVVGTQGVLDDLFSVESALKEPSLEPIPFKQRTTKNTQQGIPKLLAKIMGKENSEASYVKENHWILWDMLDLDALMAMAGAKEEDTTQVHAANRLGIQAKNDGLLREINRFQDFVRAAIEPIGKRVNEVPMYFDHVVWKQQRVGIATNMVNPQTSKLQRFMLFRKSWETQVDPSNTNQLTNFKLRVAEGFGVKTDRKSMDKALADYEQKVNDPKIVAAVQAIVATVLNGESMTPEYQDAIVAGVKAGGENFHSLDALMALAQYEHAEGKPFTTHLMGEIDGVTNGPMLTHILLGAANSAKDMFARINKGGFFQKGSEHSQYNMAKDAGLQDLYESTTGEVVTNVIEKINTQPNMSFVWDAVWKFTGDLRKTDDKTLKKRRDIIKTPLTAVMFGSSMSRSVESMAEKFVESIYSSIEDLAKKGAEEDRKDIIKQVNVLIGKDAPKWSLNMPVQQMLDTTFTPEQLKAIKGTFSRTLGKSVKETMKRSFAPLLKRRDQLNGYAQLAFTLYNSAYEALRQEYMDQVMVQGEDTDKKGNHLHDLTSEQEAELRQKVASLFPSLQTLMSLDSKQLNAGLEMMKSKRKLSDKLAYEGEVVFGKPLQVEGKNPQKTLIVHGQEVVNASPGVGMVPMGTHSLDSAISHYAAMMSEVLNVHDAHGTGLGNFFNAARNLNQKTWYALLNYSPAEQMYEGLKRTLEGMADMAGTEGVEFNWLHPVKASLLKKMAKEEFVGSIQDYLTQALVDAKLTAYEADKIKLEAMKELQYVDQYALENGNYEVTNEDRSLAEKKLSELTSTVPQELLNKISQLGKMLDSIETGTAVEEMVDHEDVDTDVAVTSLWGELGESTIKSDPELVALMEKTGEITAAQAIDFLNKRFLDGTQTRMSQFNRRLLSVLAKTVGKDLKIKYVTPQTAQTEVLEKVDFSRGWYVPNGGKSEIYVLSPEHLYSGLTTETLLHELTHAALFHVMDTVQTPEVQELVQELQALQAKAKEFIEKNGLSQHSAAVSNIHDFVAWGMTNQAFQREVLGKLSMRSKTQQNALVTGMKKFIDAVVGLLFSGSNKSNQDIAVNGMTVMINNVSGLFAAANGAQASNSTTVLSQEHVDPVDQANAYTTEDIYNALEDGSVSPAFSEQLKDLLSGIVEKLHGPFGSLKADLMKSRALSPMDVWLKTLDTGKAPFASSALNAGFNISEQEAFVLEQVEVTVEAALKDNEGQTTAVYSELRKLYEEVARKLKPSDFSDPSLYNFLFKVEANAGKRSDYLSRFASLGLASQEVSKLLQFHTDRDTRTLADAKTLLDKLKYVFSKALTLLNGKLTHTREGMMADDKLKTLVEQLVAIEDKKRRRLIPQDKNFLSTAEDIANDLTDGVRGKVTDLLKSDFVKNNKNGFIKLGATLATVSTQGQMGQVLAGIQKIKDQHLQQKNGLIMGLVNDVRGPKAWLEQLLRMRKKQEKAREFIITETGKSVMAAFSKELSTEQKAAVTTVFMRTDLKSLLGHYDMSEIQELLEYPAVLRNAIIKHEADLREFGSYQHYYVHQSKALAFQMARGQARSAMIMMNAGNIAKLLGTRHAGKVSEAQARKAEAIIDRLTSLYALSYTLVPEKSYLQHAKDVLRDEMNRSDGGNGVELVMKLHKALEDESRATLFRGNEVLMMKGYTPEIYNPHTDVKVATTPEELKELKRQGYTNEGELKQDTADGVLPGGWVMVLRDGGLQSWQTAAMSFTGRQAKGSKMQSNYTNPFDEQGLQNANNLQDVLQAKQAEIDRMFQPNPGFNPANEKRNFMVPVMNGAGTISNWRYMMSSQLKDRALDRDSRVDQVMGMLAGSVFDKQTAGEINRQVVEALKEHADKEFVYHPKSFVKVSHDSSDPEMRELYAMLPKETRDDIRKVWGKDGMQVPYEMLDVVFGYRKATLSRIWEKEQRNMAENALVLAVETVLYQFGRHVKGLSGDEAEDYSKRGAVTMRRAENIWQEIVRETKDTIVVKTGTVLFDNILSNMSLLKIHGVSWSDMARHHRVAFKAARAYQADKSQLFQLRQKVDLGLLSPEQERKALVEITKLEDSIARNPVMPLIDAGLMPTIVEDVAADDDIYSYKSQLARKLSQYEDKVHPMVSKAARNVYMAHDTAPYQFLSEVTQLSDFVARYTLYQHLTTKKNNPLSHEAAVREASESFINYDVPMHKSMQYLDDMGIIPFMKYALRIQRVLVRLTREHPARVLSMVLLNNMFDALPLVTDSGMLGRIGNNPLQWGAFKYPTVLDDLATVNSALTLMK